MNRIQRYLDIVPLPYLLMAAMAAALVLIIVPGRIRMYFLLATCVAWTEIGRLVELGMIQQVCKATNFALFLAVALAAYFHKGPKRTTPMIAWLFPAIGIFAFAFILTVQDRIFVGVLRVQWLFLTLAAIMVVRTIVDMDTLRKVLVSILIGASVAMVVTFCDLVLHPTEAFGKGIGRFEPWGANSNQIGVLYSLSAPLAAYWVINGRGWFIRVLALGMLGLAGGMALITASRSTLITLGFPMFPLMWALRKKPIIAVLGGIVVTAGLYLVLNIGEEAEFDRLGSVETGRVEIGAAYLKIIESRPLTGLMGTTGQYAIADPIIDTHPHNAYLESLYVGGIIYSAPIFILVIVTLLTTAYVWFKKKALDFDPVLISMLCFQMAIMYAHGFVNQAILYPTYTWAFMHVLVATLILSWAMDIRRGARPAVLDEPTDMEYDPFYAGAYAAEDDAGHEQADSHARPALA